MALLGTGPLKSAVVVNKARCACAVYNPLSMRAQGRMHGVITVLVGITFILLPGTKSKAPPGIIVTMERCGGYLHFQFDTAPSPICIRAAPYWCMRAESHGELFTA